MAQLVRLGMVTLEQARSEPHTADLVVLTTNPNDGAVKPGTVEAIVKAWQDNGASAAVYEWPAEMGLGHNMVDDAPNSGKSDDIYPISWTSSPKARSPASHCHRRTRPSAG